MLRAPAGRLSMIGQENRNHTKMELTLTPRAAAKAIRSLVLARQPVCLWSPPGIGKSSLMSQLATAESLSLIDLRLVTLDPTDLRGLPAISADRTRTQWIPPEFLPTDGRGILFLDELNRAPMLVQNAALQLVLDRRLGAYTLPDGWTVAAACNYSTDGGGVQKMTAALTSRFATHLHLKVDIDDWSIWALGAGLEPVTRAFIRFRPDLLHQFDRNATSFPCPRTWEFVSRITAQQPDADVELAIMAGAVGQAAALEYCAFLKLYRTLPSVDAILLDPMRAHLPKPEDSATAYAIASALARKATDQNAARVIQYLDRLPLEYGVFAVRDMTARDAAICSTHAFIDWNCKHPEVTQ